MAWLESKGGVFRIRFRFGGKKHLHALNTTNTREAHETLAWFETNARLIDQGIVESPPEGVDLGTYIVSGGKLLARPGKLTAPKQATLRSLLDSYVHDFPRDTKEENTWKTELIHIRHLMRTLDVTLPLSHVTAQTLQGYVESRSRENGKAKKKVGRRTIQKEVGTLSTIWNKWAIPQGLVATACRRRN